jgi:hypothetical protein
VGLEEGSKTEEAEVAIVAACVSAGISRRSFCDVPHCPRRILAERFDGALAGYARRTDNATELLMAFTVQAEGRWLPTGAAGWRADEPEWLRIALRSLRERREPHQADSQWVRRAGRRGCAGVDGQVLSAMQEQGALRPQVFSGTPNLVPLATGEADNSSRPSNVWRGLRGDSRIRSSEI